MLVIRRAEPIDYLTNGYGEISYLHEAEWRVSFAGLHRMVLAKLQEELIQLIGKLRTENGVTKGVLENIVCVLAKYSE